MPSITNNSSSAMAVDGTNKSNTINAMLLRAWRERWDDAQWGTHIKTVSAFEQRTNFVGYRANKPN